MAPDRPARRKRLHMPEHDLEFLCEDEGMARVPGTLRLLAKVVEQTPVGVAITSPGCVIGYANPCLAELLESSCSEMVGADLRGFRTAAGAREFRWVLDALLAGRAWQGETRFQSTRTGQTVAALESICPVRESDGAVVHLVHFVRENGGDGLAGSIRRLAFYDSLTGLPNRHLLLDRLDQTLAAAQRDRTCFALIYIDLDRFKDINDRFGHDAGDEVLRSVAARLRGSLRESDTVGRIGGDEFVAIIKSVEDADALSWVAGKLVAACAQLHVFHGAHCAVTASVGVSIYPRHGLAAGALLKAADGAMYQAKAAGRNAFRLANSLPDRH